MNLDDINKNIDEDQNFIPGIYNYCDSWCDRCKFTSRCRNYSMRTEFEKGLEKKDAENDKDFWEKWDLDNTAINNMLQDETEDLDFGYGDLTDYELKAEKEAENAKNEPCYKLSQNYYERVNTWFENANEIFTKDWRKLKKNAEIDVQKDDSNNCFAAIDEAVEIISWYEHFICAKLYRALTGRQDESFAEKFNYPKDSEGSAKVALISIDRSITAWGILLKYLPQEKDNILIVLTLLEKLRRNVEEEFPEARNFIRIGFDAMPG